MVLKKFNINLLESKKALSDWHGQLKGFLALNQNDFSFNKSITVTSDELSRLDRALDFLQRSSESPEVTFRQPVEIITREFEGLIQHTRCQAKIPEPDDGVFGKIFRQRLPSLLEKTGLHVGHQPD